jgi:hypothetical protein
VIQGPSRLAGIAVDDDLVARLVTDTDNGSVIVGVTHKKILSA